MKQEANNCTMEFNETAKEILEGIKGFFSIFYGKGIQSIGSGILGWIFWVIAFIILICGIIPAIPFAIMMAISLAVGKWFFYKFRTL